MELDKKLFGLTILALIAGIMAGFYFGNKFSQENMKIIQMEDTGDKSVAKIAADNVGLAKLKLSLLKSYTDFVLLSPEKNADVAKYAENIKKEVEAINDAEITSRFRDTLVGNDSARSQKVNDFLDFLNDSIKNNLQ